MCQISAELQNQILAWQKKTFEQIKAKEDDLLTDKIHVPRTAPLSQHLWNCMKYQT